MGYVSANAVSAWEIATRQAGALLAACIVTIQVR